MDFLLHRVGRLGRQLLAVAAVAGTSVLAGPAPGHAAVVFDTWTSVNVAAGNYRLTVADTGTQFEWSLTVDPWNAEVLGLFVDLGAVTLPGGVSVGNPSGSISVVAQDTSAGTCGSGCNLNGLPLPALSGGDWELVFRLGGAGFDGVQTFSWMTSNFGLDESALLLVGVRAQQLCSGAGTLPDGNCGGSDKAYAWPAAAPTPGGPELFVLPPPPEPGTALPTPGTPLLVLLAGAALINLRRHRQQR